VKRALVAAFLLTGLGLVVPQARAQTGTARGKVMDTQGQPIADAKVLIEFQGGITRKFEVKTKKKGDFMQVGMQPGLYRFTVSKEGFQSSFADHRIALGDPTQVPEFRLNTTAQAVQQAGGAEAATLRTNFQKAVELQAAGRLDEAEAAYKAISEASPDIPEVYQNLGSLYLVKKDYAAAETAFQKGLELRPDSTDLSALLARVYQESGQPEKAMALIEKSAGDNPQDAKAQFNRGIFLLNANKSEEAIAAFEAAIKADPEMPDAHYHLATQLVGQGKIADSIAHLEKYLSLAPPDAQNVGTAQGLLKALKK